MLEKDNLTITSNVYYSDKKNSWVLISEASQRQCTLKIGGCQGTRGTNANVPSDVIRCLDTIPRCH